MQLFLQGRQAAHHFKQGRRRNSDEIPSPPIFYSAALLFPLAEHIGSCPAKGAQCQTAAHQNRAAVTVLGFFPDLERTQTGKAIARQDPNFKDGRPKKFTQEQIELAWQTKEVHPSATSAWTVSLGARQDLHPNHSHDGDQQKHTHSSKSGVPPPLTLCALPAEK